MLTLEIFKAGKQTDASGKRHNFTTEQLRQAVETFEPDTPFIISHDDKMPAIGWLKRVWQRGNSLWAEIKPTFVGDRLLKEGLWKKVSVGFYAPDSPVNPTPGKLKIRHLAAVHVPAVKGLDLTGLPDFSELKVSQSDLLEIPMEYKLDFSELEEILDEVEDVDSDEVIRNLTEPTRELESEIIALKALVDSQQQQLLRGEALSFSEKLVREGKIPPSANNEAFHNFLVSLRSASSEMNFSEDGQNAYEYFTEFLSNLPTAFNFKEKSLLTLDDIATEADIDPETPEGRQALHAKAKKLAKEKNMTFAQALKQCMSK